MNRPDGPAAPDAFLPPQGTDEPVFAEPWQAQVFAMVVALHQRGLFSWNEWATALGRRLGGQAACDDGSDAYAHWLGALEDLLIAKGATRSGDIDRLARAWAEAAEATPHGQPITLSPQSVASSCG